MSHNLGCSNVENLTLKHRQNFNVETTSEFRHWYNVSFSALEQRRNFNVKQRLDVETTSHFQRWANVRITTLKQRLTFNVETTSIINIETTSEFQCWNNVGISTLKQRQGFYVHSTFKSNQNSTSFQRWGPTLFNVGSTLKCLLGICYMNLNPCTCIIKTEIYLLIHATARSF